MSFLINQPVSVRFKICLTLCTRNLDIIIFIFHYLLFRLAAWILNTNQNGFKVPDRHVINAAKLFHNISEGLEPIISYGGNPGKSWYKGFVERFPIAAHNQNSDFHKIEFSLEKVIRVL